MTYEIYSGAGNDFLMLGNFEGTVPFEKQAARVIELCSERFKDIDGVIFADMPRHTGSAVRMSYYNRDGSFGAMCGNGARCTAMFAYRHGITAEKKFTLEAVDELYTAEIIDGTNVRITFPPPKEIKTDIAVAAELDRELKDLYLSYVNVGSDHLVIFIDDEKNKAALGSAPLEAIDINTAGNVLRHHSEFQPRGANVNFVQPLGGSSIKLRTYERGVERETLACGTGIVSSAVIAAVEAGLKPPVEVYVQSGEKLTVDFRLSGGEVTNLSLTGSAKKISEGEI